VCSPERSISLFHLPKHHDLICPSTCSFHALYGNPAQICRFCRADVMPDRNWELSNIAQLPALDTCLNTLTRITMSPCVTREMYNTLPHCSTHSLSVCLSVCPSTVWSAVYMHYRLADSACLSTRGQHSLMVKPAHVLPPFRDTRTKISCKILKHFAKTICL
jgi:hypothetical protein